MIAEGQTQTLQKQEENSASLFRTDLHSGICHCANCGAIVDDDSLFCEECGARLQKVSESHEVQKIQEVIPEKKIEETKETNAIPEVQQTQSNQKVSSEIPSSNLGQPAASVLNQLLQRQKTTKKSVIHTSTKNSSIVAIKERAKESGSAPKLQTLVMQEREEKKKTGWVCNFCGCYHTRPEECSCPELGGTWQYRTIKTMAISKL